MALILNIDTSTENGSIALAENGIVLSKLNNSNQKDHAAWIHPAIKELVSENGTSLADLNAVAIAGGPGSYTGLRVAMSTAKGLCYALKIPLIMENTLKIMASGILQDPEYTFPADLKLCPMIDARRMEVFTAIYDMTLNELMEPRAMVLDQDSFNDELERSGINFFGNGAGKFKNLVTHSNAEFVSRMHDAADLASLAETKFAKGDFEDLAYAVPVYIKGFFDTRKK